MADPRDERAPRHGEVSSLRRRRRTQQRRERLGWLVLLVACLAVLAWPAAEAVRLTRSFAGGERHRQAAAEEAVYDCLDRRTDELVTPGQRVFIQAGIDLTLELRLAESVTARPARAVADPGQADLTLMLAAAGPGPAPAPGVTPTGQPGCGGFDLTAVPR